MQTGKSQAIWEMSFFAQKIQCPFSHTPHPDSYVAGRKIYHPAHACAQIDSISYQVQFRYVCGAALAVACWVYSWHDCDGNGNSAFSVGVTRAKKKTLWSNASLDVSRWAGFIVRQPSRKSMTVSCTMVVPCSLAVAPALSSPSRAAQWSGKNFWCRALLEQQLHCHRLVRLQPLWLKCFCVGFM